MSSATAAQARRIVRLNVSDHCCGGMLNTTQTHGKPGSKMNQYEIRVQGHLDQRWSAWFDGLTMTYDSDDNTVLCGPLVDEAALHGVLIKVRDLALPLLEVHRVEGSGAEPESHDAEL
jgi:hypothetical protein